MMRGTRHAFVSSLADGEKFTPDQLTKLYSEAVSNLVRLDFASLLGFKRAKEKPSSADGPKQEPDGEPAKAERRLASCSRQLKP